MREELIEFVANMKPEDSLEQLKCVCESMEEVKQVINLYLLLHEDDERVVEEPSNEMKIKAYAKFENVPKWEITTALVQRKLLCGYGTACSVKEWLLKIKD